MRQFLGPIFLGLLIEISRYNRLRWLPLSTWKRNCIELFNSLEGDIAKKAKKYRAKSKSQINQDIFALAESNFKKNGFFVDIGAADGIELSNSYLLEKEFNWNGILVEPARIWQEDLLSNRSAQTDFDCVWKDSGKLLSFFESEVKVLSTISEFRSHDFNVEGRKHGKTYSVKSVSLMELLERHNAPREIDYLSIDTEGSEYEILQAFDFDASKISIITCEHNFTGNREKIHNLLSSKGFVQKFKHISDFDDWYVLA
jgi:FkbM family methyltransferase